MAASRWVALGESCDSFGLCEDSRDRGENQRDSVPATVGGMAGQGRAPFAEVQAGDPFSRCWGVGHHRPLSDLPPCLLAQCLSGGRGK